MISDSLQGLITGAGWAGGIHGSGSREKRLVQPDKLPMDNNNLGIIKLFYMPKDKCTPEFGIAGMGPKNINIFSTWEHYN